MGKAEITAVLAIERIVQSASVGDLLDALGPDSWPHEGWRCPLCRVASAQPIDAVRWTCLGRWDDRVPANPRAVTRRLHVGCGVRTIYTLQDAVLRSADALERLIERREAA